jgi:hypothetical protein
MKNTRSMRRDLRPLTPTQLAGIAGGEGGDVTTAPTDDELAYGYIRIKKLNSGG